MLRKEREMPHAPRDPRAAKLRDFRHGVIDAKCSRRCAWALVIARHERLKDLRRPHALDLVEVEKVIVEPGLGIHSLPWPSEYPDLVPATTHPCVRFGCEALVGYDDEPFCYTHSSNSGSYVRGYSYRKANS
jgi:hypothetical protein